MRMPEALGRFVTVLDARLPIYRLVLILVGALAFAGLWWFQERTRYGAVVRAGLDDPQMVEAIGINIGLVSRVVFILGACLAGAAGVLGGPIIGVNPLVPYDFLLLSMVVIVIGGLGSIRGAFAAALIVGVTDNVGRALFLSSPTSPCSGRWRSSWCFGPAACLDGASDAHGTPGGGSPGHRHYAGRRPARVLPDPPGSSRDLGHLLPERRSLARARRCSRRWATRRSLALAASRRASYRRASC